jgi:hypothetical protein
MAPVILITFAGRKSRMEILTQYINKAIEKGIVDEWHIWDFARSADDRQWVTDTFGPVKFMQQDADYRHVGSVSKLSPFRLDAKIGGDLHIGVVPNDDPQNFYEIVVGGWDNHQSAVRKLPRAGLKSFNRDDAPSMLSFTTPGILSPSLANPVILKVRDDGVPVLQVNEVPIGTLDGVNLSQGAEIMVRGGWGSDLEIMGVRDRIHRYVGPTNEKYPYHHTYAYYSQRAEQFTDAIFVKCDDDIVYMNLDKLADFINFRRDNPRPFMVSANVVNNGVCAHLQQLAGTIPASLGEFEMPPGGLGGSLWQSPERAAQLHDFFLAKPDKRMPLQEAAVEVKERVSINFISWLGRDLRHMGFRKLGDEAALSVYLPAMLDRPTKIFSDFVVSHLSFGPQEQGLDVDRLIAAYEKLMRDTLPA